MLQTLFLIGAQGLDRAPCLPHDAGAARHLMPSFAQQAPSEADYSALGWRWRSVGLMQPELPLRLAAAPSLRYQIPGNGRCLKQGLAGQALGPADCLQSAEIWRHGAFAQLQRPYSVAASQQGWCGQSC